MQLATALVVNAAQLCIHIRIQPFTGRRGPGEAALLNRMQTMTLVLTTYINFGALALNYLALAKAHAQFFEPDAVDEYDFPISFVGIGMQVLTVCVLLTFGGFGGGFVKKATPRLQLLSHHITS